MTGWQSKNSNSDRHHHREGLPRQDLVLVEHRQPEAGAENRVDDGRERMVPFIGACRRERSRIAVIGGRIVEGERPFGRRLPVVAEDEPTVPLLEQPRGRVHVGEVEHAAGCQTPRRRRGPPTNIVQPADRAPTGEDEIELAARDRRSIIDIGLDKIGHEPGLKRQSARRGDGRR